MYPKYILAIFAVLTTFLSLGAEEIYSTRRSGAAFENNFTMTVVDGRYDELGFGTFVNRTPQLLIKFGVEEREAFGYLDAFVSLTVNFTITPFSPSGVELAPQNKSLTISYSPDGGSIETIDMAWFKTSGYHKYKIEVQSLSLPVPDNIYIEAELSVDRFYEVSTTTPLAGCNYVYYSGFDSTVVHLPSTNGIVPSNGHELEIWWDYIKGAEYYELEWTWVNNYGVGGDSLSAAQIDFNTRDFEHNNTRILTKEQNYRIPLIYAKGFLIYRIRGVGQWIDNSLQDTEIPKYGPWSSDGITINKVEDWPHYVKLSTPHEALKNWQYQSVYAEDGKKKEVISYFDGSLRNRQTITRINSDHQVVVGESIYDNQGRSAVQILPAPVASTALKYYPKLNVNTTGDPYSHHDFDWEPVAGVTCSVAASIMDSTSGASYYYSSENTLTGNWQSYLPLAGGYPYIQVEYTPDNTGRIRAQSGVGETYKIDSTHATKYYYLQPTQEELNRLFGYYVGYKSRYKKNLVVDANGQVSISYIDPQGRVIATALAGTNSVNEEETTTNLKSLDEEQYGNHAEVTYDLLNKYHPQDHDTPVDDNKPFNTGANGPHLDALLVNTQLGSTENNSPYNFVYKVQTDVFSDSCSGDYSYPFAYHLAINATDDCGFSMLDSGAIEVNITGTNPSGNFLSSAGITNTQDFDAVLNTGAYTVHKLISVNRDTLLVHLAHYLENNICMLEPVDFFENTVDCFDEYPEGAVLDSMEFTTCLVTREMMLADLNPGGQYGGTEGIDLTSIFSPVNTLPHGDAPTLPIQQLWKQPATYYDIYGNISYVEVHEVTTGVFDPELDPIVTSTSMLIAGDASGEWLAKPQQLLHVSDFIANWSPTWADQLLQYHPEYCYLAYLDTLCSRTYTNDAGTMSTEVYDTYLRAVETYAEATSGTNYFGGDLTAMDELMNQDPYFHIAYTTVASNGLKNALMDSILQNYKATTLSLWEFSIKTVICGSDFAGACTIPASIVADLDNTTDLTLSTAQKDHIWQIYRETYISEKKKINQVFMDVYAIEADCYNGFIGEEIPSTPSVTGFLYYPDLTVPGYNALIGTTVIDLYFDAILTAGAGDPFPWMATPFSILFADKIKRVIPIDNLYDSSVPEDVMISTLQQENDAQVYAQTGRCDLSFDVEYFLNAMAQNDLMNSSGIPAATVPQLTVDLLTAMGGGTVPVAGAVTINTSTDVVNDEKDFGVSVGMTSLLCSGGSPLISLGAPTGLDWDDYLTNWQILEMSMLYYVPGSFSSPNYDFQILAIVATTTDTAEYVLDGVTCVQIGECEYESSDCPRYANLGDELVALFAAIYDQDLTNDNVMDWIGNWYTSSELMHLLHDDASNPTALVSIDSLDAFSVELGTSSITVDLVFSPSDIAAITGGDFNAATQQLTIYYIDTNGDSQTFVADITYVNNGSGSSIVMGCICPAAEAQLAGAYEDMLNYLLENYPGGEDVLAITDLNELEALQPFMDGGDTSVTSFKADTTLSVWFTGSSCRPAMHSEDVADFSDLIGVYNIEVVYGSGIDIGFSGYGILSDSTIVTLTPANFVTCMEIRSCEPCVPQTVAPLSCNEMWLTYNNALTALNTNITTPGYDLFPLMTEADFCETNLAYLVNDYLYYLETFTILDPEHDKYITLAAFGNTNLNYGYDASEGESDNVVVDSFLVYQSIDSLITWGNFVNQVYLPAVEICPPAPMLQPIDGTFLYPCEQLTANIDTVNAANQYDIYLNNMAANFTQRYIEDAMSSLIENFDVTFNDKEYHYTLYYYDQAGNLVQTVPPKGVDRIEEQITGTGGAQITAAADLKDTRATNIPVANPDILPVHTYETIYTYNTLNQLVKQQTPDGGTSYFAYDALGRLVVSQNELQLGNDQMSYTKYDNLGRIIEVGEMDLSTGVYTFNEDGNLILTADSSLVNVSHVNFPANISSSREEVTRTLYDVALSTTIENLFENYSLWNTRNRITGVLYFDTFTTLTVLEDDYASATFYDYDVHGNVKEVIQDIHDADLVALGQNIKKTKYEYDLVSGNVKEVAYQDEETDQFMHRYNYDADNRITLVETSHDDVVWEQDAKYFYYSHGPLARAEIGHKKVQANDFAYTIQGWLKGVNGEDLTINNDMGKDAKTATINGMNSKDVYGYSLHYFEGDYQTIDGNDFLAYSSNAASYTNPYNLFNGNIKEMYTAISDADEDTLGTNHTWYQYDQLNRIKNMNSELINSVSGITVTSGKYESKYWYDPNGNLDSLVRWANISGSKTLMDNFKYHYNSGNNQLNYVDDAAGYAGVSDLGVLSTNNYMYDSIGQLVKDVSEDIDIISWRVTGKVDKIIYDDALNMGKSTSIDKIEFEYDAMGNRIAKKVTQLNGDYEATFYFLDAQGNPMSTYSYQHLVSEDEKLYLSERNIYGSSRVGTEIVGKIIASSDTLTINMDLDSHQVIGDKRYELSNHLGNVLNVITDRKVSMETSMGSEVLAYYTADVVSYSDYFPFGMVLPGRNGSVEDYRYGFQGQEEDDEIKGDGNSVNYTYRMHDPRIGRFLSLDPLMRKYPFYSPYIFSGNRVIDKVELEGLEPAEPKVGASTLIIVIQGVGENPAEGQTQAQNDPNSAIDMDGIGALTTMSSDEIQVVVFSSSTQYNTMIDVGVTIGAFKVANPDGNVVVVGHSQGADNAVEILDFCQNTLTVDLLITLDIKDAGTNNLLTLDSDNIYSNVTNAINYYQTADFIGGEDIEVQDATKTNGANILSPGSNHRSIDNDLYPYIVQDIMNFLNGEDVVKKAQERTLPTFDPADTGSPEMPGNSLKSESETEKKNKGKAKNN